MKSQDSILKEGKEEKAGTMWWLAPEGKTVLQLEVGRNKEIGDESLAPSAHQAGDADRGVGTHDVLLPTLYLHHHSMPSQFVVRQHSFRTRFRDIVRTRDKKAMIIVHSRNPLLYGICQL